MGRYLNPNDMSKEDWLETNARPLSSIPTTHTCLYEGEPHTVAVLIQNGGFTACGLAYSQAELDAFSHVTDPRPKQFWLVPDGLTHAFL